MSVLCKAVVLLLSASPAVAQSQAFEVISIKPARSGDPRNTRMRVLPNGDLNASDRAIPREAGQEGTRKWHTYRHSARQACR